jgi:hypothetical protein
MTSQENLSSSNNELIICIGREESKEKLPKRTGDPDWRGSDMGEMGSDYHRRMVGYLPPINAEGNRLTSSGPVSPFRHM